MCRAQSTSGECQVSLGKQHSDQGPPVMCYHLHTDMSVCTTADHYTSVATRATTTTTTTTATTHVDNNEYSNSDNQWTTHNADLN